MTNELPVVGGIEDFSQLEKEVHLIANKSVTDLYFAPKKFERSGRLYETLGVRYFKRALCGLAERVIKNIKSKPTNYFIGPERTITALKSFERQTRFNEVVHLFSTGCLSFAAIGSASGGQYSLAAMWGAFDLVLGIYPVLVQRYNRARIYNTIDQKLESRK